MSTGSAIFAQLTQLHAQHTDTQTMLHVTRVAIGQSMHSVYAMHTKMKPALVKISD